MESFLEKNATGKIDDLSTPTKKLNKENIQGDYGVPNIKVTPAEIFANKVAMLDANYFNNTYENKVGGEKRSIVFALKEIVSSFYNTFRLIAIVGLLSVLVYIGIRILLLTISNNAEQQAKYKNMLQDWLAALCLIFCLHYFMAFVMNATEVVLNIMSGSDVTTGKQNSNDFSIAKELYFYVEKTSNSASDEDDNNDDENDNEILMAKEVIEKSQDEAYDENKYEELVKYFNGLKMPGEEDLTLDFLRQNFLEDEIKAMLYAYENPNEYSAGFTPQYVLFTIIRKNLGTVKDDDFDKQMEDNGYPGYYKLIQNYTEIKNYGKDISSSGDYENLPENVDKRGKYPVAFYTNLTGYMRILIENTDFAPKAVATLMYLALTFYTIYYIWIYLKRLITLTFLTMIAPLVALTYPLDKLKDKKAQAFTFWTKEYIANAILPIIQFLLYKVLVTSAADLVINVPIYAIFALAFIVPSEKIVKSMFGLTAKTTPPPGGLISGVGTASVLQKIANGKPEEYYEKEEKNSNKIRFKPNGIKGEIGDYIGLQNATQLDSQLMGSAANNGVGYSLEDIAKDGPIFRDEERGKKKKGYSLEDIAKDGPIFRDEERGKKKKGYSLEDIAKEGPIFRDESRNTENYGSKRINSNSNISTKPKRSILGNAKRMAKRRFNLPNGTIATGLTLLGRGAKLAGKLGIVAAGAGIGLAGGIVGGKLSDTWKGFAGGAVAGGIFANKVLNGQGNGTSDFFTELFKGEDYAALKISDREFIKDEENMNYMRKYHSELKGKDMIAYMKKMNLYKISGAGKDMETLDKLVQWENEIKSNTNITEAQAQKAMVALGKYSGKLSAKDFAKGKAEELANSLKEALVQTGVSEEQAENVAVEMVEKSSILNGMPTKIDKDKMHKNKTENQTAEKKKKEKREALRRERKKKDKNGFTTESKAERLEKKNKKRNNSKSKTREDDRKNFENDKNRFLENTKNETIFKDEEKNNPIKVLTKAAKEGPIFRDEEHKKNNKNDNAQIKKTIRIKK